MTPSKGKKRQWPCGGRETKRKNSLPFDLLSAPPTGGTSQKLGVRDTVHRGQPSRAQSAWWGADLYRQMGNMWHEVSLPPGSCSPGTPKERATDCISALLTPLARCPPAGHSLHNLM